MSNITSVHVNDCIPMKEVLRLGYNQYDYENLRHCISEDGFNRAYPVRGIWVNGKFEVFDGINRLRAVKEIGLQAKISAIVEAISRSQCIEQGIKSNLYRAAMNPMDLARHLRSLGIELNKATHPKHAGRPVTINVRQVAEKMKMSKAKISQFMELVHLPKDVQKLIEGSKLKFGFARELCRLLKTPYEDRIPDIAESCVEGSWNRRILVSVISKTLSGKEYTEGTEWKCDDCHKTMSKDLLNKKFQCPDCANEETRLYKENHRLRLQLFLRNHGVMKRLPDSFELLT